MIWFCLVLAWAICRAWEEGRAQAGAEVRRVRAQVAREIRRQMDAGWAAGPGASFWWWPAAGYRAWGAMHGPRPGAARPTALPGSTPLRRVMQAAWTGGVRGGAEGRDRARQRRDAHQAARAAGTTRTYRAARSAAAGAGYAAGRWWPWQSGPVTVVRMRACDDCGVACAETALALGPREVDGHTEFWLLCAACRAAGETAAPSAEETAPSAAEDTEDTGSRGPAALELPASGDEPLDDLDADPEQAVPDGQEVPGTPAHAAGPDTSVTTEKAATTEELEEDNMTTGTSPAVAGSGGESYTHGAWNQATAGIHQRLAAGLPQALEVMLASLNSADAGRAQVAGVMGLADAVESWAAQVRSMLADVNAREVPVTEAVEAAGGPGEVAGIPYLSEV